MGRGWWAAVAAVVLSFPLLYWTVRGMEVGVVVLATVATLLLTWSLVHRASTPAGRLVALGLVAAFAVAVRQDTMVVVVAVSGWALWRGGRPGRRVANIAIGSAAAATLALTATRWSIYGELLPNTYHLKVEGIGLQTRLGRGLLVDAITAGPYFVAPLALVLRGRRPSVDAGRARRWWWVRALRSRWCAAWLPASCSSARVG
ncbi:MAG: hypothetical protein V9E94_02020 [Microthrixaceae bacterium]